MFDFDCEVAIRVGVGSCNGSMRIKNMDWVQDFIIKWKNIRKKQIFQRRSEWHKMMGPDRYVYTFRKIVITVCLKVRN